MLTLDPSTHPPIHSPIARSLIHPSIHPSIHLSIHPSTHPPTHWLLCVRATASPTARATAACGSSSSTRRARSRSGGASTRWTRYLTDYIHRIHACGDWIRLMDEWPYQGEEWDGRTDATLQVPSFVTPSRRQGRRDACILYIAVYTPPPTPFYRGPTQQPEISTPINHSITVQHNNLT